jgi:DNA invertase Pin-like site-specific DNA recombinase
VVLGLEVSRLARSSSDWHRLLEICALTDTLILDEDGLYNPGHFNDRLLLGLKGTMSEAELHVLRARLIGGQRAKASRGELEMKLPIGLIHDPTGKVVVDPDRQVQAALRTLFETFRRTGSATSTVRTFREQGLLFPRRLDSGPHRAELAWGPLLHTRALRTLKNPRYAGAFAFGRSQTRRHRRAPSSACSFRASGGTRSFATHIPATSVGTSTRRTFASCTTTRRPAAPTGGMVRHVKDQRCCKVWRCAVGVADG